MSVDTFYQTSAQICFTLLGLWWLVLQTKYAEWIGNRARRRMATNISLYFLLPGAMSLMALASHARVFWATAFVLASLVGGIETAFIVLRPPVARRRLWHEYALGVAGVVLYALILLVAVLPFISTSLSVAPLTIETILLTLLVVLGAGLAWRYFAEPHASASR